MTAPGNRKTAQALVLAATVLVNGCSLLVVRGPARDYRVTRDARCTPSNLAPTVDILVAVATVARTLIVLTSPASGSQGRGPDIVLGLGLTGLFTGSAAVGLARTDSCRDAIEELQHPPGWRPPPPPEPNYVE